MNTHFFLQLERLQKLDALLRLAQTRGNADLLEIALLRARKRTLRERLGDMVNRHTIRPGLMGRAT